ncbi:MAG: helix-turn-helix transcriptional regulator [Pseudohongiellaceae bacterium]
MTWLNDTIASLAISQLFLLGSFFLIHHNWRFLSRLMILFSICLIAYLLTTTSAVSAMPLLELLLLRLAIATPAVLWLIARELFVDTGETPRVAWWLMGYYLLVRALGVPFYSPESTYGDFWFLLIYVIPQVIMLGFSIHSIYIAFSGRGDDLIEERRRVRVPFVISMGALLAVIVGNGFFSFSDPMLDRLRFLSYSGLPVMLFSLYTFLITFAFNLTIFRLHGDAFSLIVQSEPTTGGEPPQVERVRRVDSKLVDRILATIEKDRYYAEMGLTIGDLAERLSIQEYKLRKIINKQMHYRNFNQFLNYFRIRDACERLKGTDESVANIAMEVGYASLSSFNKAFKDIQGVPPRTYRVDATREPHAGA